MKKIMLLGITAVILVTALMGCNMFRGAGQDLKNTADNVQDAGR